MQGLFKELGDVVDNKCLSSHLDESLLFPFVEYARHIETGTSEQSCQLLHLYVHCLGTLRCGTQVMDKAGEFLLRCMGTNGPLAFAQVLYLSTEEVEEVDAEYLVRFEQGIYILLVDAEQ